MAYDIAIIGGGIVGSTLACLLQSARKRVILLEAHPHVSKIFEKHSPPGLRVSSITPSNINMFKQLGIWKQVPRSTPFTEMHVWTATTERQGRVVWRANEMNCDELGSIVENDALQSVLLEQAEGQNVEIRHATKLMKIEEGLLPTLHLSDGSAIKTRLVVGADGPTSIVKKHKHISSIGVDYAQHAVVATIRTTNEHQTAYQRFLPDGPLAMLPCHDKYSSIVWSTTPHHAKQLVNMPAQQFLLELNHAYRAKPAEFRLDEMNSLINTALSQKLDRLLTVLFQEYEPPPTAIDVVGSRASFPLKIVHSTRYVAPRYALIGDAAHVVHPMAGQGLNLGIGDAIALSCELIDAVKSGQDVGDIVALERYERKRMAANLQMMAAIHTLRSVFSPQRGPVAHIRTAALDAFNSLSWVKRRAAAHAMGVDINSTSSGSFVMM